MKGEIGLLELSRRTGVYSYLAFSVLLLFISILGAVISVFLHNLAGSLYGPGSFVASIFYFMALIALAFAALALMAAFGLSVSVVLTRVLYRR